MQRATAQCRTDQQHKMTVDDCTQYGSLYEVALSTPDGSSKVQLAQSDQMGIRNTLLI